MCFLSTTFPNAPAHPPPSHPKIHTTPRNFNLWDEERISALLERRARTSFKSILSGGKMTFTLTTTLTQTGSIFNRVLTMQVAK